MVPGGSLLLGFQTAAFCPCPHGAGREKALVSLPILIRALIPFGGLHHHGLPRALPPNSITLGVKASVYGLEVEHKHSVSYRFEAEDLRLTSSKR